MQIWALFMTRDKHFYVLAEKVCGQAFQLVFVYRSITRLWPAKIFLQVEEQVIISWCGAETGKQKHSSISQLTCTITPTTTPTPTPRCLRYKEIPGTTKVFITFLLKSRRIRWAGHVERMSEERGCIGSWWGNRREGDHWGDLGVDGWIILGWICRR